MSDLLIRWAVIIGIMLAAATFGAVQMHKYDQIKYDALEKSFNEFTGGVQALGEKAKIDAAAHEKADRARKEAADAKHRKDSADLAAALDSLRAEREDRARSGFLPSPGGTTCGPDGADLYWSNVDRALRELDKEVQGIVDAGTKAVTDLNNAQVLGAVTMTTIATNGKEIAGDTRCVWEGIGTDAYGTIKIYSGPAGLYGITGGNCEGSITALEWLKASRNAADKPMPPEYEHDWDWKILELSKDGVAVYNERLERDQILDAVMAVGSGRKVALYCMKYLGMSPPEAVREACKVDHWSETPIYSASLEDPTVQRWQPPKPKKPRSK